MQIVHFNRLKPFISYNDRPGTLEVIDPNDENSKNNNKAFQDQPAEEDRDEDNDIQTDPAEFQVKAILDKKVVKNRSERKQTYYLVEWVDANLEPSWEPLNNLHCGEILREFENSLLNKKVK